MTAVSTHVLDSALGTPRGGVTVVVQAEDGRMLASGVTDDDGRIDALADLGPGTVRLVFDVRGDFFPEAVVTISITDETRVHVPLLIAPNGWSTYRDS